MIEKITSIAGWNIYLIILVIILSAGIHLIIAKNLTRSRTIEIILMYIIGISGFQGITNFIGHAFFADSIANSIGWPAGSPFQLEIAGANLGIGLIGYLGFRRRDFWLPYIIARTCFAWTAATTHIIDQMQSNNFSPNNAGPIVYWSFILPIVMIVLYFIHYRMTMGEKKGFIRIHPLQ